MGGQRAAGSVITSRRLVGAAVAYLVVAWGSVFLIDVADLGGGGSALNIPLWVNLFHESYVTELLQWTALGAAVAVAGHLGGRLRAGGGSSLGAFWVLMSVALVLMLIEDAGNPRHALGNFAQSLLGISGFITNMAILAVVAAVPAYAVLRHWRAVWPHRPGRGYLIGAFAAYALAGGLSGSGPLWYHRGGEWLDSALFAGRLPVAETVDGGQGFLVMDLMVEESVELLGAALFLAATVAFLRSVPASDAPPREPAPLP